MNEREYELATLINSLQYDITKLKEELESKYHEGYMDGKAFKDRHITMRDHFAGLAMQGVVVSRPTWEDTRRIALTSYEMADAMMAEREKNENEISTT
jgi:hypothetical protein